MAIVYIGIGSNVGNRLKNIETALRLLKRYRLNIIKCSTVIETEPVGGPRLQGKFLNAVIKAETDWLPEELLTQLKLIELRLGRKQTVRNGPRTIDLDILLYNHLHWHSPRLTIPHPRMLQRDFVMQPLKEIDPQLVKELHYAHC